MSRDSAALVEVDAVGKKYCRSLKRSLLYLTKDLAKELLGQDVAREQLRQGEFYAVKDVSFRLHRGECLGVIGPNGAGKSTILKLLAGVQRPDSGVIRVRGRVGSLIELGAGLHPLLTGRENILLLGSLYGFSSAEVERRMDWIVDFSGLESFLETPVRSFSSGMVARLGFSVAACFEPAVLLVDEVLSVGDLDFQARCLARVAELRRQGTGIILVSHQMSVVDKISNEVMLMRPGTRPLLGPAFKMIEDYRQLMMDAGGPGERVDHPALTVTSVQVRPVQGDRILPGSALVIEAEYECHAPVSGYVSFALHKGYGEQIAACRTDRDGYGKIDFRPGRGAFSMHVDSVPLAPGHYAVSARVYGESGLEYLVNHHASYPFLVAGGEDVIGVVNLKHSWHFRHGE